MSYLLDTNAVIALLKRNPVLLGRMRLHEPDEFFLSSIVLHELFYGAYRSERRDANLRDIDLLVFKTLPFGAEEARRAGSLRAVLATAGKPIGPMDVLIAGQALTHNLTVITRNTREFARIDGLKVEDWESEG